MKSEILLIVLDGLSVSEVYMHYVNLQHFRKYRSVSRSIVSYTHESFVESDFNMMLFNLQQILNFNLIEFI